MHIFRRLLFLREIATIIRRCVFFFLYFRLITTVFNLSKYPEVKSRPAQRPMEQHGGIILVAVRVVVLVVRRDVVVFHIRAWLAVSSNTEEGVPCHKKNRKIRDPSAP